MKSFLISIIVLSSCSTLSSSDKNQGAYYSSTDTLLYNDSSTGTRLVTIQQTDSASNELRLTIDSNFNDRIERKIDITGGDKENFFGLFLASVLSTISALLVAFLVHSYTEKKKIQKQESEEKEEYLKLLNLIAIELQKNYKLVAKYAYYANLNSVPTFSLSVFMKDSIMQNSTSLLKSPELFSRIISKYFEFDHLQNRHEICKELLAAGLNSSAEKRRFASEMGGFSSLARGNVKGTIKLCYDISRLLSNEGYKNQPKIEDPELVCKNLTRTLKQDSDILSLLKKSGRRASSLPDFCQ